MATTSTSAPAVPATSRRRGEMNFSLRRLDPPLQLQQVALDPTWNKFKTVMVFVGGVLFFLVFGTVMFWMGGGGDSNLSLAPQVIERVVERPAPTSVPAPAVQPTPASAEPGELTPEELDRRHSDYIRRRGQ